LWVIFIFAGMLSFTSVFGRELKTGGGGLTAIRSFPLKPQSLFLGKLLFSLTILFVVQFIIVLIYFLFFHLTFKLDFIQVFVVLLIGTLDYACIGTLVSALALYSRAKTLVVPILIFPLIIPSVMLSVNLLIALILGISDQSTINNFLLLFFHFVIILMISFLSIEVIIQD
jgi:heme exporter protein B